jgi:hypothetical protein
MIHGRRWNLKEWSADLALFSIHCTHIVSISVLLQCSVASADNLFLLYQIWGGHGGENGKYGILNYNVLYFCRWLPTFRRNISHSSNTLKMEKFPLLRNVGNYLQDYTASQVRSQQSSLFHTYSDRIPWMYNFICVIDSTVGPVHTTVHWTCIVQALCYL